MPELNHYSSVLCSSQLLNKVNYDEDKESHVRALLEFLAVRSLVNRCFTLYYDSRSRFPFHLVIETSSWKSTPKPMRVMNFVCFFKPLAFLG